MQLVENWPAVLKKAWSLKFNAAAAVFGGLEVVVGQVQPAGIPNGIFAGIAMAVSIGAFAARLLAQQEIHDAPAK